MNNNYRPVGFGGGFLSFPPVIKNLLIINGVVFFFQILLDNTIEGRIFLNKWLALNPININGYIDWPFNFQIWQLITYQFMHGGFSHILLICLLYGCLAPVLKMYLDQKVFNFYLLAGISAGLLHLFVSPLLGGVPALTIGASGSVYGVLIAYALFFPDNLIFLYFLIPVKAKYLIGF